MDRARLLFWRCSWALLLDVGVPAGSRLFQRVELEYERASFRRLQRQRGRSVRT